MQHFCGKGGLLQELLFQINITSHAVVPYRSGALLGNRLLLLEGDLAAFLRVRFLPNPSKSSSAESVHKFQKGGSGLYIIEEKLTIFIPWRSAYFRAERREERGVNVRGKTGMHAGQLEFRKGR